MSLNWDKLRHLPKQRVFLLALLIIAVVAWLFVNQLSNIRPSSYQPIESRFVDQAGLFPPAFVTQMNNDLHYEYNELGIDIHYLIIPSLPPNQTMEEFALDQARAMAIGATTNQRGILCVYNAKTQQFRIEVGPRLEGVMPDAFVSYLELENTHAYASNRDLGLGLRLTEHLIVARLR